MVHLPENKLTDRVYLPSTLHLPEEQRAWVILKTRLKFGDTDLMFEVDTEFDKHAAGLARIVTNWNLTSREDESPLPITLENIKELETADIHYLNKYLNSLKDDVTAPIEDEQKKTSTVTLTPPVKVETAI